MKTIIFVAVIFAIANTEASYAPAPLPVPAAHAYGPPASAPASVPSVPCPKSILVSCAPSVKAVPCQSGGSGLGYGSSIGGAYTENIAQYASPQDLTSLPNHFESQRQFAPLPYVPQY